MAKGQGRGMREGGKWGGVFVLARAEERGRRRVTEGTCPGVGRGREGNPVLAGYGGGGYPCLGWEEWRQRGGVPLSWSGVPPLFSPPPRVDRHKPVKTLTCRRTTYAGGKTSKL